MTILAFGIGILVGIGVSIAWAYGAMDPLK